MKVGIIHVGIGNTGSLHGALYNLGVDPVLVRHPDDLDGADRLVLPGVGTFSEAMIGLHRDHLFDAVRAFAAKGRPVLGICLGMQLLCDEGAEGGHHFGLGLIAGTVNPFIPTEQARVPHVGWNELVVKRKHPVLAGIRREVDFYFVHSYYVATKNQENVVATSFHGQEFAAVVARGNVLGMQFHPEKSQRNGLQLLENFCDWEGVW